MQFTCTFALLAAFSSLVAALPTEKRTPIKNVACHPDHKFSGILSIEDPTGSYNAGLTAVTAKDSQGLQKKVLVTKNADGSALTGQTFDFVPCDSDFMGYPTLAEALSDDDANQQKRGLDPITRSPIIYGHLTLGGASKHCVQTKTGSVRSSTVLTNSLCSFADDKSQIQNFWALDLMSSEVTFVGSSSTGTHHPTSLSRSLVKSGAVKLNPVDDDPSMTTTYLKLTQPETDGATAATA